MVNSGYLLLLLYGDVCSLSAVPFQGYSFNVISFHTTLYIVSVGLTSPFDFASEMYATECYNAKKLLFNLE